MAATAAVLAQQAAAPLDDSFERDSQDGTAAPSTSHNPQPAVAAAAAAIRVSRDVTAAATSTPLLSTSSTAQQLSAQDIDAIRSSPEYAVAWDLELWRSVQQNRLAAQMKEREKTAMELLKAKLLAKERADTSTLDRREREIAAREKKVQQDALALDRRRMKLVDAEKEVLRQLQEAEELRKRLEIDSEDRVKRAREEVVHKVDLHAQRATRAEAHAAAVEERLGAAQKEYLKLWEEFNDFRLRRAGESVPQSQAQLDAVRAQHETTVLFLTERHERRVADMQTASQNKIDALTQENQKLRDAKRGLTVENRVLADQLQAVRAELERLTAEHMTQALAKAAAAGQPSSSRTKEATSKSRGPAARDTGKHHHSQHHPSTAAAGHSRDPGVAEAVHVLQGRVAQWQAEKRRLLEDFGGAYTVEDPIVVELERRIREAESLLLDAASSSY